jgi:hypothetical protein
MCLCASITENKICLESTALSHHYVAQFNNRGAMKDYQIGCYEVSHIGVK